MTPKPFAARELRPAAHPARFIVLDGWRGICALLVALHHFALAGPIYGLALIRNANLFVDFFFVLSGFVITHAYGQRIGTASTAASFILKRLGRVWPVHLAMLLLLICLEAARASLGGAGLDRPPFTGVDSWTTILPNALLLHAFNTLGGLSWNVPSWSISVEMGAYAVFAAGLMAFRSRLPWFAAFVVAVSVTMLANMPNRYVDATQDFGLFRGLIGFFLGHLVYQLRARQVGPAFAVLPRATELEWAITVLVFLFVCAAGEGWLPLLAPFLFAAAVYLFSFESGALSRALTLPASTFLGKVSYSIYMVHYPIVLIVGAVCAFASKRFGLHLVVAGKDRMADKLLDFGSASSDGLATLLFLGITIGAAAMTYYFIERPGQDMVLRALQAGRACRLEKAR